MIGSRCRILLGEIEGNVVGHRTYIGEQDRWAVRYIDESGPQERWFQSGELSFERRQAEGCVVDFRRAS